MKNKEKVSGQTIRKCDIFISYRREGGDMTAMYFYQSLKERGYNVFYDLEVLRAGKFNEALLNSIQSCTDFVLILSPHALDRCVDEKDWVRQEVAEALRTKKNIVPVMLKGFSFPEQLPEDIDEVRYQNGMTCTTEYFEESINRLCERYLQSSPQKKQNAKLTLIPVVAVLAALVVGIGAFFATRKSGQKEAATEQTVPAAAIETTETPSETSDSKPTAKANVVRNTFFPALSQAFDDLQGNVTKQGCMNSLVLNHPTLRRRDVASVHFLPSLEGAPEEAWDVSDVGDGSVMAWITPNDDLYDLTIAGNGGVKILEAKGDSVMFSYYSNMKYIDFNGCVDLSERDDWSHMFYYCSNLRKVDLNGICCDSATNMEGAFASCWELKSIDISGLNTSLVINFSIMFMDCKSLKQAELGNLDTSNAENMQGMFQDCVSLKTVNVSGFNTSSVTNMSDMFRGCSSLVEVSTTNWDVSSVENMQNMFRYCENLENIGRDPATLEHGNSLGIYFGCKKLKTS